VIGEEAGAVVKIIILVSIREMFPNSHLDPKRFSALQKYRVRQVNLMGLRLVAT
jgi:DNA-binding sugar fermentation-stimulating protein